LRPVDREAACNWTFREGAVVSEAPQVAELPDIQDIVHRFHSYHSRIAIED
jgi:hypothetical protein